MGNQREIRQVSPTSHLGVAISVKDHCVEAVSDILARYTPGHFCTYLVAPGDRTSFPNLDGPDTKLAASTGTRLIIQSGGKMWCGYDAFCEHISEIARHLQDCHFFVADEEDYIDEFVVADGRLSLLRVHSGCWLPLDEFLAERFPYLKPE